jgi:alanyl-tRNA synthetase
METQKALARANQKKGEYVSADSLEGIEEFKEKTVFTGYDTLIDNARILAIWKQGEPCDSVGIDEKAVILLDKTPFYGESGGQTGDTGYIESPETGFKAQVAGSDKIQGISVSSIIVVKGFFKKNSLVRAVTHEYERRSTEKNHTATHLLHAALKQVLGKHVNQAGSLVGPNRLRFDFTHFEKMSLEDIKAVETLVNQEIMKNTPLCTEIKEYAQAVKEGAMALFDEKYEDRVRVIEVPGFSKELCGGTHVKSTGEIGSFKILSESSVSQGIRRIEAAAGMNAFIRHQQCQDLIDNIADAINTNPDSIIDNIEKMKNLIRLKDKELEKIKQKDVAAKIDKLISHALKAGRASIVPACVKDLDMPGLRDLTDRILERVKSGVILAVSDYQEKVFIVAKVSKDLIPGVKAGSLVKAMAMECGGSGGGRPDMAQAGGKDPSKIDQALKKGIELAQTGLKE